jgi:excisionase family DNA binding protein
LILGVVAERADCSGSALVQRMSDDTLINCKDAAALLGISPRTLERYVAEAQIPYIRFPQRGDRAPIRFSRSQLRKWLDHHSVKPSPLSRFGGNTHAGEVREDEVSGRISA